MAISELDIHRTAKVMIDQYGESALLEAMKRIEGYHQKKNQNGAYLWNKIADAIEWQQTPENLSRETMH